MSKYLICEFKHHPYGSLVSCYTSDLGLPVSPDFSSLGDGDINPEVGKRYLVEITRTCRLNRFVYVHESTFDIFCGVQPLLLEAMWQPPEHVTSEPWVEVISEKYGPIKAKFFRPTGGRYVKFSFVEIQFSTEDEKWHSFTFEDGREVSLSELAKRVHACVGPAINLAAAISRQKDNRRSSRW